MPTVGVLVLRYASANSRSVPASMFWVMTVTVASAASDVALRQEIPRNTVSTIEATKMSRRMFLPPLTLGDLVCTPGRKRQGQGQKHDYFAPEGTGCFNSSNQFSTTLIWSGNCCCPAAFSIKKCWPSGETS
jgi:hypothetical protein